MSCKYILTIYCYYYYSYIIIAKLTPIDKPISVQSSCKQQPLLTDDTSEEDWIPDIHLTSDDQKILQSKEAWLSDRIICAGQILLKREFGDSIMGLQNTVIGQGRGVFKSVPNHQKFLQILNLAGKHWILVANIHPRTTSNANVRIYDSYKKKIVTSRACIYCMIFAA